MDTRQSSRSAIGRRSFLRAAALAAATPILTEAALAHAAADPAKPGAPPSGMALHGQGPNIPPPGAVLINANENPLGPSKAACDAIARMAPLGGRYDRNGETELLAMTFAAQNGLKVENVAVYAGSSEPLHYSVLAFTSPDRSFVTADPSYEAGMYAAMTSKARIVKVPLAADYGHDVKAMVAADPNAGVIYICNPNNPTGTTTTKQDIVWALDNKPKGSILLVDEAYIHLSDAQDALDLVAAGKDLIVLRTFSKIYGMAGIRCGFAVARPDLLAKLKPFGQNAMPITGSAAARASLEDTTLVATRKAIIGDTRRDTLAWLKANNYKVIGAPETNCFMIDTGRDGKSVIAAMKAQNVYIGRTWPIWPNAVRVSVGTPAEMAAFKTAFKAVMDSKAVAVETHDAGGHRADLGYYATA
ncbi:pyridoxal phosphate-dependent aminotransferase [Caulobacter sp. UNC279MFTsu5.1]|uniref:pyridoxal phosphate-dependent aminotransferase n=1 Tax=Caulobacter sp. UNC279MFTsu5.1 TaxID=1502775 RepID=UPI0008E6D683|nr:pyridoxal phosphate-dependent aminotransferase [Caulobacter sp. UNC279MFTsu5.1]SFJ07535.1 histidinol-phosphate aminotransferase [Caulobacter sp. UNC279MFTsu5.1]